MKQVSTLFLRGVIVFIGLIVLAICLFILPAGVRAEEMYRPILIGLYVAAVPFYGALFQTMKLLQYIDTDKAFSDLSILALKRIKYCALAIWALFVAGLPLLYDRANKDDAPGVLALGLVIAFASFVIATFAEVLQKLLQNAIAIKTENDLTV
jgi:hypothetical protein